MIKYISQEDAWALAKEAQERNFPIIDNPARTLTVKQVAAFANAAIQHFIDHNKGKLPEPICYVFQYHTGGISTTYSNEAKAIEDWDHLIPHIGEVIALHPADQLSQAVALAKVEAGNLCAEIERVSLINYEVLAALGEVTHELKVGNTHTIATDTYKSHNELIHRLDKILNAGYRSAAISATKDTASGEKV